MNTQKSKHICKQCHKQFEDYEALVSHFSGRHNAVFRYVTDWIDRTTPTEYNDSQ